MLENSTVLRSESASLYEPLILPSDNTNSPKMSIVERPVSVAKQKDYLAGRIYASNAPRIMLETITARTALIIIALTYIFFIIGFGLDFYTTYQGFNGSNKIIGAGNCANFTLNSDVTQQGCTQGNRWVSTITDLTNVLSVKLNVQQNNITTLVANLEAAGNNTFEIKYDVSMWACYNQHGCQDNFYGSDSYTDNPNVWQSVLSLQQQTIDVNVKRDYTENTLGEGFNFLLIPNTFQNQESIPTNGLVKAYLVEVTYTEDPYDLFIDTARAADVSYYFNVVSRPRTEALNILTIILMIITLAVLGLYIYVLLMQDKVLSEQKWVVAYFILLILFQNPDYSVIVFFKNPPTVTAAFASYVVGYFAQSGLFILWLLFADSIKRKTNSKTIFYMPKVFIGLVIFTTGIVVLTFQFPGLDPTTNRSAVQAVTNWSSTLKDDFVAFTILYICLIWTWTIMWFVQLIVTGRRLNKLPYMSTRYIQLSYRFFFLQATLVTIYYIFQYAAVVYYISSGTSDTNGSKNNYNPTSLTDNINTLFRQQTQLFGKILFLTVYAIIIAFFFLPANLGDKTGVIASLAATYVITENEHTNLVKTRQVAINKVKANLLNKVTRMNEIVNAKSDVFCVDMAINLRNIAFQAYYDPPNCKTASGYEGVMDLDKVGFFLIDMCYDKNHEVFCFICREKKTDRIVVAFRGTASKRQMEDNLNFKQMSVDFHALNTSTLDYMDGLTIKPEELEQYHDEDLEEIDEDDEILAQEYEDSNGFRRSNSFFGTGARDSNVEGDDAHRDTVVERAGYVGDALNNFLTGAVDTANKGIDAVVGLSAGVAVAAASKTPILKSIVKPGVHCGFWEAYSHVRDFVHAILRRELVKTPTTVFFTGHSLGGALATLAAVDVSINTVPRVNAYLKHKQRQAYGSLLAEKKNTGLLGGLMKNFNLTGQSSSRSRTQSSAVRASEAQSPMQSPHASDDGQPPSHNQLLRESSYDSRSARSAQASGATGASYASSHAGRPKFVRKIKLFMYNYGSPRVGNTSFAQVYNTEVPRSYRVVVDGDLVTGLPPSGYLLRGYQHVGTEIMIDNTGAGSIIIDPSFVERWLRTNTKNSVAAHSLLVYRKGLLGIKLCAEFMKQRAVDYAKDDMDADPLRLALKVRGSIHADQIMDETDGYVAGLDDEGELEVRSMHPSWSVDKPPKEPGSTRPSTASAIELRVSPSTSSAGPPAIEPATPDGLRLKKQLSTQVIITPSEAKMAAGDTSVQVTKDMEREDAMHYAHDVEQMEAMMHQIKGLKRTGPIKWLKNNTINRLGGKKNSDSAMGQQQQQEEAGEVEEGRNSEEEVKRDTEVSSASKSSRGVMSKLFHHSSSSSSNSNSSAKQGGSASDTSS